MLAQLLRKHGLGARVAGYKAVSRDGIRDLDLTGVAMVCISYLDISGNPAHLRYLLERLKRRAPGIPVLVGLWPVGEKVLSDAAIGRQIGGRRLRLLVARRRRSLPENGRKAGACYGDGRLGSSAWAG